METFSNGQFINVLIIVFFFDKIRRISTYMLAESHFWYKNQILEIQIIF